MHFSHLPFGFNLRKGSTNLHFHYVLLVMSAAGCPINKGLHSQVSSVELRPWSGFFLRINPIRHCCSPGMLCFENVIVCVHLKIQIRLGPPEPSNEDAMRGGAQVASIDMSRPLGRRLRARLRGLCVNQALHFSTHWRIKPL